MLHEGELHREHTAVRFEDAAAISIDGAAYRCFVDRVQTNSVLLSIAVGVRSDLRRAKAPLPIRKVVPVGRPTAVPEPVFQSSQEFDNA